MADVGCSKRNSCMKRDGCAEGVQAISGNARTGSFVGATRVTVISTSRDQMIPGQLVHACGFCFCRRLSHCCKTESKQAKTAHRELHASAGWHMGMEAGIPCWRAAQAAISARITPLLVACGVQRRAQSWNGRKPMACKASLQRILVFCSWREDMSIAGC
jgi:hypothetical protein